MKKTLIALLALGSMAMGEEVSLFTLRTTTTTPATHEAAGTYVTTAIDLDGSLVSVTGQTSAQDVTIPSEQTLTSSGYTNSMFTVQTNIGNGGSYTFEQNFRVDVKDGATITLTSLDVDFFAYGANGQQQTVDRGFKATLTLTKESTPLFNSKVTDYTIPAGKGITTTAYDENGKRVANAGGITPNFTLSPSVNLSDGDYKLSIKVENLTSGQGTYIGIGNVALKGTVSQVPEPATGTLSLLALAGLCARRRKK